MPNRDLNKLLSNSNPQSKPEIKRGQGYRLSTEVEAEPQNAEVQQLEYAQDSKILSVQQDKLEDAQVHELENAQSGENDGVQRSSRGIRLSDDLFYECKRVAVEQRRKLYEVVEQALSEYLERYQAEVPARPKKQNR